METGNGNTNENTAAQGNNNEDSPGTGTDNFEHFLTHNQLPYYRDTRRRSCAQTRLAIRIDFLKKCRDNTLTPSDIVYKPTPPQGAPLTPGEIIAWKEDITFCEQKMLHRYILVLERELNTRNRELPPSEQALREQLQHDPNLWEKCQQELSKSVSSTRTTHMKSYTDLYSKAERRRQDFLNTTNVQQLLSLSDNRYRNNDGEPRSNSRSRSRSRSRNASPAAPPAGSNRGNRNGRGRPQTETREANNPNQAPPEAEPSTSGNSNNGSELQQFAQMMNELIPQLITANRGGNYQGYSRGNHRGGRNNRGGRQGGRPYSRARGNRPARN